MEGTIFVELFIVHPHIIFFLCFFDCCFIFISLVEDIAGVHWGMCLDKTAAAL